MNIFKYNGYSYFTKANTLSKTDIENILNYFIKDRKIDVSQIPSHVMEEQRKHIKTNAKKYEIIKLSLTKKYHTPDILLRGAKKSIDIINHKSKLINFKFHDLFKYNKDYTKFIQKYNKPIQCKLNMSGFAKSPYELKTIENGVTTFTYESNIKSMLQINANKINIIDNNMYLYYLDKPYIFEITDKTFLEYFKKHTEKRIKGARGTIAKASSVNTPKVQTDDKIKQAYEDLKAQAFTDCQFEILGNWLWVTTLNEQVKDYLLQHNFKFSLQHLKFYLHFDEYKKRSNTTLSYDKIKELYGGKI